MKKKTIFANVIQSFDIFDAYQTSHFNVSKFIVKKNEKLTCEKIDESNFIEIEKFQQFFATIVDFKFNKKRKIDNVV